MAETARKKGARKKKVRGKSIATKKMIISAARRVFVKYPYHKASIRTIAEEGGFHFSLINHYFSKSSLFGAVAAEVSEEILQVFSTWLVDLDKMSPEKGLALFLDRALDYFFQSPDVLSILMNNASQAGTDETAPGFDHFSKYVFSGGDIVLDALKLGDRSQEVVVWFYGFLNLLINYVGAARYHCQILNMEPRSAAYREWVKRSLMYLFLPTLKELMRRKTNASGKEP